MLLEGLLTDTASITTIIGVLAMIVYIIVEQTKELPFLKSFPTQCYTILVSIAVTYLTLFGCLAYNKNSVTPALFIFAFIGSFVIAFVADNGWQLVNNMRDRFIPK